METRWLGVNLVLHLCTRHARKYPWAGSQRSVDLSLTIFSLRTGITSREFDSGDGLDDGGLPSILVSENTYRADIYKRGRFGAVGKCSSGLFQRPSPDPISLRKGRV